MTLSLTRARARTPTPALTLTLTLTLALALTPALTLTLTLALALTPALTLTLTRWRLGRAWQLVRSYEGQCGHTHEFVMKIRTDMWINDESRRPFRSIYHDVVAPIEP